MSEHVTRSAPLRLHLNENTAGCSPRVLAALQAVTRQQAAFYPDYEAATRACATRLGVSPDRVVLTNGLDEGILAAAIRAARDRNACDVVIVQPAFDMYETCAAAAGARIVNIPPEPEFRFPLERVLDAIGPRTSLVFLTTPNNPTGVPIRRDAILHVAERARHTMVFVDEAYADFAGVTLIGDPALDALPNVVIGRTFAKAYGLAGLRAGALIAHAPVLDPIRRVLPPYSVNAYAVAAIQAAFEDLDYYTWYLAQVAESKTLLYTALERLGVRFWPSAANFVLACFGENAPRVLAGLAQRGITVRDRSQDPGCNGCIRITAGVAAHTRACIDALEEVLCGAQ